LTGSRLQRWGGRWGQLSTPSAPSAPCSHHNRGSRTRTRTRTRTRNRGWEDAQRRPDANTCSCSCSLHRLLHRASSRSNTRRLRLALSFLNFKSACSVAPMLTPHEHHPIHNASGAHLHSSHRP
jgi:hypothetical protein